MMIGLAGILTALAFPTALFSHRLPNLGWLAWIAIVPLYWGLREASPRQALKQGYVFAIPFYGLSFYWVAIALRVYGDLALWQSVGGLLGVAAIFSSMLAATLAGVAWLRSKGIPLLVGLPLCWVAQDLLRNYFPFGGFPWSNLAYTQAAYLPLVQSLDLLGIHGLTLLILLLNGGLAFGLRRDASKLARWVLCISLCLFALNGAYGVMRMRQVDAAMAQLPKKRVALIQGNIPQDEKWLEDMSDEILERYLKYSHQAEQSHPDLLIWPEAAYPAVVPPEWIELMPIHDLKIPLLTGAVTFEGMLPESWPPPPDFTEFSLHNSSMIINPGGSIGDFYHKRHLVPFGEYVPLQKVLFFIEKLVPGISSFSPGEEWNLIGVDLPNLEKMQMGVMICYEDIFPEPARYFTRQQADFLVNLTNDAWYERASMVYQHLDYSRYRAIENRRTMVRATNTGMTAIIDPVGRVVTQLPPFTEGVLPGEVSLGGPNSVYTRWGDWLAWGCVLGLVGCFLRVFKKR